MVRKQWDSGFLAHLGERMEVRGGTAIDEAAGSAMTHPLTLTLSPKGAREPNQTDLPPSKFQLRVRFAPFNRET